MIIDRSAICNTAEAEIFGKIVQNTLNIGEYQMHACICLCKNIIGGLNISDFTKKWPISKIYSSPIFRPKRYLLVINMQ